MTKAEKREFKTASILAISLMLYVFVAMQGCSTTGGVSDLDRSEKRVDSR